MSKNGNWRAASIAAFEAKIADVDAWLAATEDLIALFKASGFKDAAQEQRSAMGQVKTVRSDLDDEAGQLRAELEEMRSA